MHKRVQRSHVFLSWLGKEEMLETLEDPSHCELIACREESAHFDETQNVFIEGDNLEVLKLLQKSYSGKVKMIYIDPPYNTGKKRLYKDKFQSRHCYHSAWLNMMYPRLYLARNLLCEDGLIFISIDTTEESNLIQIADNIFGEENRLASLVWEKRYGRSNNAKTFTTITERVLCYRKSVELLEIKELRNEKADSTYANPDSDPRGIWTSVSYVNPATKVQRPNLAYTIVNPITGDEVNHPKNAWKYAQSVYETHVKENRLYWGINGHNSYPRLKKFLTEMGGKMVPVDFWDRKSAGTTDEASKLLKSLFGIKVFDFPKPHTLIQRALLLIDSSDYIVLDFFSGSCTTAHAVMQMNAEDGGNRKYIMVQLPEPCNEKSEAFKAGYKTVADIGKERIRRAAKKITESHPDKLQQLDLGFKVFKLKDAAK